MPLVASFLPKQLPLSAYHPQKPPPPDPLAIPGHSWPFLAIPGHSWPSLAAFKAQIAGGESGAEGTVQGASGTSFTLHLGDAQLLAVAVDEAWHHAHTWWRRKMDIDFSPTV